MQIKRWMFPILTGLFGFLCSFIMSFQVNTFSTSFVRGVLSFVIFFLLFELCRFVVIYSFPDLFSGDKISTDDAVDVDRDDDSEIELKDSDTTSSENSSVSEQTSSPQTEKDYADVAQFVKTELAKSEVESPNS